jgi:hypothetical protein
MVYTEDGKSVYVTDNPTDLKEGQRALPLYTKPEWQGLTDDELEEFENIKLGTYDLCLEVEEKLQEKNGG